MLDRVNCWRVDLCSPDQSVAARLAICFCLGALLGTLLDGIHVYGDVESYPDPLLGRWAWFVPLEFGLAGALAGALIPALERRVGPPSPPHWPLRVRVAELCLIVAAYLSTVLLDDAPVLVTAGLLALLAIRLTVRPVPGDWVYALIGAAVGPVVEATISALGGFDYSDPDVAGIPMWLPALWALGGIFIRRLFLPIVLYRSRSSTSPPSVPT
jgi:Protein of unknown function (DUF2878)